MSGPIPEKVSHEDFRVAIKPLLDLLHVTDQEVHADLTIGPSSKGNPVAIRFNAVARAEGDDNEFPAGQLTLDGLAERPQPFTELVWPVTVEVV